MCFIILRNTPQENIFSENTGVRNKGVIIISQFRADSDLDCESEITPLRTLDRMLNQGTKVRNRSFFFLEWCGVCGVSKSQHQV